MTPIAFLRPVAYHISQNWTLSVGGLRARGWRAVLVVGILASVLAANTLLFAVADSLLFRPLPYRDVDRLVTLKAVFSDGRPAQTLALPPPSVLDDLRERRDLFSIVHAYTRGSYTFIMSELAATGEPTAFLTPGLFEMLGWAPAYGRTFTAADVSGLSPRVVIVAQSLAAERFGRSDLALGRTLETSEDPLLIVGVMPKGFRFPNQSVRMWRPLDHPHATSALYAIGHLARAVSSDQATAGLAGLSTELAAQRVIPPGGTMVTAPLDGAETQMPALLALVIGAAACLLIIACANTASVELAGAIARARTFAIHVSLGATRASLLRTSALEGALVVGGAAALALAIVKLAEETLAASLPDRMMRYVANPVQLDAHALAFMAALTGLTWLAVSLPVAIYASRPNVLAVLQAAAHAVSPADVRTRRALTVLQVALAVLLLVIGVLYTRTYTALLGVEKGFDSTGVVAIHLTLPTAIYSAPGERRLLADQVRAALERRPDVESFALLPNVLDEGTTLNAEIELDDGSRLPEASRIAMRTADAAFFETMRLPVLRGRGFQPGDPDTNVLITPDLAERLWPGGDPLGRSFRLGRTDPWLTVVGIVHHLRYQDEVPGAHRQGRAFQLYAPLPAPVTVASATPSPDGRSAPTSAAPQPNVPRSGPIFMSLSLAARLSPEARLSDLQAELRRIGTQFGLEVRPIDEAYAEAHQERLLAARTVRGFAALSFLLAIASVYGSMALLVANRRREFGIRAALGADWRRIQAQVLSSAARLVGLGALLGVGAAVAVSRIVRSQLFGVETTDPLTYVTVLTVVFGTALLASWIPAVQASRVDPVRAIRADQY